MDTATINNCEWIIRLLRPGEIVAIEEMANELVLVFTPIVILPPNADQMGFEGPGARHWDIDVNVLCRRLLHRSITFVQSRLGEDRI